MTKSIGIIELYQHHEVLAHYCRLLLPSEDQIYVFCTEKLFDLLPIELRSSRINWILKPRSISVNTFVLKHESQFKTLDRLIICTVFSNFRSYLALSHWTKTILVIHNAQTWFSPLTNIKFRHNKKLTDILRLGKFLIQRQYFFRKKLLESVFKIALPNSKIVHYVKKHYSNNVGSKLIALPFAAYESTTERISKTDTAFINIVIPGTVSDEIRDYDFVIKAFKNSQNKFHSPIRLTLLGQSKSPYGKRIISQFQDLESTNFSFSFYPTYIEQHEYDKQLLTADYLLLPIKEIAQFHIFEEKSCLTKISGSINDMIRFGIPSIVSRYVSIDDKIDDALIKYNSLGDLEHTLKNLHKPESQNVFDHYRHAILLEDFKSQISL